MLAFERWRFTAKWAEDEPELTAAAVTRATAHPAASLGSQQPKPQPMQQSQHRKLKAAAAAAASRSDPVLPYGSLPAAAEAGLVADLVRAGLHQEVAAAVALQLAEAAAMAAASVTKRRHQLASGKALTTPEIAIAFHKHSLDLACGSRFVKVRELLGILQQAKCTLERVLQQVSVPAYWYASARQTHATSGPYVLQGWGIQ